MLPVKASRRTGIGISAERDVFVWSRPIGLLFCFSGRRCGSQVVEPVYPSQSWGNTLPDKLENAKEGGPV